MSLLLTPASEIRFFVPGDPKPAGSKRGFVVWPKGGGKPRAIVTDDCKTGRDWKADVKAFAHGKMAGKSLLEGALQVEVIFVLRRPKSHYRATCLLRPNAPTYHTHRPDADKLSRAVLDACTGVLWRDDAQIAKKIVTKRYGETTGVSVCVEVLEP